MPRFDSRRPPDLELTVPGLGRGEGKRKDILRVSSGTRDAKRYAQLRQMLRDYRDAIGGVDVLRALYDRKFDLDQLWHARQQGPDAVKALLAASEGTPLRTLADAFLEQYVTSRPLEAERMLARFLASFDTPTPTTKDFTAPAIIGYLSSLRKLGRGKGEKASGGTKNRYRALIQAFATWMVQMHRLDVSPFDQGKGIPMYEEAGKRLPEMDPVEEFPKFLRIAESRGGAEVALALEFLTLTGADVGEIIGEEGDEDVVRVEHIRWADSPQKRTRVRLKRPKVRKSPERLVPIPKTLADKIRAHVALWQLERHERLFGMVGYSKLRFAHEAAASGIGKPRLNRKDLRHIAAIWWRKYERADLQTIQKRLGHLKLSQTAVYSDFTEDDEYEDEGYRKLEQRLGQGQDVIPMKRREA